MTPIHERAARAWCLALARTLPVQHISPHGHPYLERYFAAGWSPSDRRTGPAAPRSGPAIFLHHFVASDPDDQVHSHPWGWSASLILAGGYTEHRCLSDGTAIVREYTPGDLNVLEADDLHRVDLLSTDMLADGASHTPLDVNTAITIGKTGGAAVVTTGVDVILTYAAD